MRVCIYDAAEGGILEWAWAEGSYLLGRFDHVIDAMSWDDAWVALDRLPPGPIDALHIWSHGAPGRPLIDGRSGYVKPLTKRLAPRIRPTSRVWFRACAVFQGSVGQDFAVELANGLGCTVVGHTRIIGAPWQSGGYALRPGEVPHWSVDDAGYSGPFVPNTCLVTKMTVPPGWFR